jgi:hypothetical protein
MTKSVIIAMVAIGLLIFGIAMYFVSNILKKTDDWFSIPPLLEFAATDTTTRFDFEVEQPGQYVFCVVMKRDFKPVRPPLGKIDFSIQNRNKQTLNLKTGLMVWKQINSSNFKEMVYILAEFEVDQTGKHELTMNGREGTKPTDKFIIRPSVSFLND